MPFKRGIKSMSDMYLWSLIATSIVLSFGFGFVSGLYWQWYKLKDKIK